MRRSVIMATPQVNLTSKSVLLVLCVSVKVNYRLEPHVGGERSHKVWDATMRQVPCEEIYT